MTYGDGVCDVDMNELLAFHRQQGKLCTVTAPLAGQRFGVFDMDSENPGLVSDFREKADQDGARINGGYMVMEPGVFDYIEGDDTFFEKEPMHDLVRDGQLAAYRYDGFWRCMDTARERDELTTLIETGKAPWIKW